MVRVARTRTQRPAVGAKLVSQRLKEALREQRGDVPLAASDLLQLRAHEGAPRVEVALAGATGWLAVADWWCLRNYRKFGHPFPHQYMLRQVAVMREHPIMAEPLAYRRPIGWVLPTQFEWLGWPYGPWSRPNFWANLVAGTWSDTLHRGLCRSRPPGATVTAWREATRVKFHCLNASGPASGSAASSPSSACRG